MEYVPLVTAIFKVLLVSEMRFFKLITHWRQKREQKPSGLWLLRPSSRKAEGYTADQQMETQYSSWMLCAILMESHFLGSHLYVLSSLNFINWDT